jgi:hypothetical protein
MLVDAAADPGRPRRRKRKVAAGLIGVERRNFMERRIRTTLARPALLGLAVAVAALLGAGGAAQGTIDLDHFKCYKIERGMPPQAFVELADQFDVDPLTGAIIFEPALVLDPVRFCNPVKKTVVGGVDTPISDPDAHLKLYLIRQPTQRKEVVLVSNQFTNPQGETFDLAGPIILAVPTQKRPHPAPQRLDHFKCYRVRQAKVVGVPVRLADQFREEDARVGFPILFCNPTAKIHGVSVDAAGNVTPSVTDIQNPAGHLTCYWIVSAARKPAGLVRTIHVRNQFGEEKLAIREADILCVPSTKVRLTSDTVPPPP